MSEKVLVIKREEIPQDWLEDKINKKVKVNTLELLHPYIQWVDRDIAEEDESVKQIIPYLIIESEDDNKIAIYQRKGSEKRIHGLHSVGIGGHVNPEDLKVGDSFIQLIIRSAKRELFEEFTEITPGKSIRFLGIINEEITKVGRTHLGLVFKLTVKGRPLPAEELHNLRWEHPQSIFDNFKLEMWSEMALSLSGTPTSIDTFFGNLKLTSDQQKTIHQLDEFLSGSGQVFILKGYAGTGKTTLLKGIAQFLHVHGRMGHIMAPTGRAAKVIQDKTGYPATTIHKGIYNFNELETYEPKNSSETFKYFFTLNHLPKDIDRVFIFDEASMIGNQYTEGEFFRFGSGYLLNDVLQYFELHSNKNTKLIFVGDPAQLPPVKDRSSLALDKDYFIQAGYDCSTIELTDVVRQSKKSGILKNAEYYRKLIFSSKVAENILDIGFDDIEEIKVEQLADKFISFAEIPDVSKNIIITYSNNAAYRYNKLIRSRYFPETDNVAAGDILQVVRNNYSNKQQELLNGEFIKVLEVSDKIEEQTAPIKIKGTESKQITLKFRDAKLLHPSGAIITIKLLDTLLNNRFVDLSSDETKALYINFIIRYEKRTGKKADRKAMDFKEAFKNDKYYNALQVKYGYAITGHKSQGGEWENAFVDFSGRVGLNKDSLRWIYTAITRASKKLFVLYPPGISSIDFTNVKINIGKINKLPSNAIEYPQVNATPYHDKETHPAKLLKYLEIEEKMHNIGYTIEHVETQEYIEKYTINTGTDVYQISMNNRADGIFTYYTSNIINDETTKLINLFKERMPWPYYYHYENNNTLVNKLYNKVLAAMQGLKIDIIGIDEANMKNYFITFYFRTTADGAFIQFYFDKNRRVKNMIIKSLLGNDDTELKKLINNLTT